MLLLASNKAHFRLTFSIFRGQRSRNLHWKWWTDVSPHSSVLAAARRRWRSGFINKRSLCVDCARMGHNISLPQVSTCRPRSAVFPPSYVLGRCLTDSLCTKSRAASRGFDLCRNMFTSYSRYTKGQSSAFLAPGPAGNFHWLVSCKCDPPV